MAVFVKNLKQSGKLDQIHITVGNIGSRKSTVEDDYGSGDWGLLAPNLTIYGFDADLDACEAANADLADRQINWQEKHIPLAISNSVGTALLYVTRNLNCTSLYPPNNSYLDRFGKFGEFFKTDYTVEIETTTLDNYCEEEGIKEIDFLQIDTQGANLKVLQGASSLLANGVLGIKIEVEFSQLYINQPLFADSDTYLRENDFTMFDLELKGRYIRAGSPVYTLAHPGQLVWGDAYYFRDLISEKFNSPLKTPEQILKLACITDIIGFSDYALELLRYLTLHYGQDLTYNFVDNIVESLSNFPEMTESQIEMVKSSLIIGDN